MERKFPTKIAHRAGDKFAKWQLPDEFVFLPELPHTSTGKLLKSRLREQFREFDWASNSL